MAKKRKTISVVKVLDCVRILNNELASEASQSVKAGICTVIENLLMDCDRYRGYQLLYWTKQGCDEWRADVINQVAYDTAMSVVS